jgi:hypothetical protein
MTSNVILGRFPSKAFLSRPEAADILRKFIPVTKAIRKGDLAAFKRSLGPAAGNERWFFQKGVLLQLLSRAEVLVWRSLARKVFLLTYQVSSDPNSRAAPNLNLRCLVVAAQYCQRLLEGYTWSPLTKSLVPPRNGPIGLRANEGTIYGNHEPEMEEIEAIVANLVQQGLLHGYVSHNLHRYVILGSKQRGGALNAGFPEPWGAMLARTQGLDGEVPGWVRKERRVMMGGVVNLSGVARPVGSGQ